MEKYIPTVITLDDDSINRLADALASRIGAVPQWNQARAVPPWRAHATAHRDTGALWRRGDDRERGKDAWTCAFDRASNA